MPDAMVLALFGLLLLLVLLLLARWHARKHAPARRPIAVIDGSNVMHWRDNTPGLEPVQSVLRLLEDKGYLAGVIFDASAGYRLTGRYLHDHHFHSLLDIDEAQIMVVPKGRQADPYLLRYAQDTGAIIISNDRFRDRIAEFPTLAEPGRLIRGGWRDGKVWLNLP